MKKVNKFTRASKYGKILVCPKCDKNTRVYHFNWYAIMCYHCKSEVKKLDWLVAKEQKAL